jgi:coenzyme F420-0:L-glutamate ligase/coenzyme F420-1:gamma-L-glutamate ligase
MVDPRRRFDYCNNTLIAMRHAPTDDELSFVAARRIGHLATANGAGQPSVVPFCYALLSTAAGPVIVSALDEKPKSRPLNQIQRVRNIGENRFVSVVVDDYNDDWSRLRFVQLSGEATLIDPGAPGFDDGIAALRCKYSQYQSMAIDRAPMLWIGELISISWTSSPGGLANPRSSDFTSLIQGRRSVRSLRADPVPRPLVEQAIAAAGWAPSPHGRQPWRFSVVESEIRKRSLADQMAETWQEQLELDGQDETIVQIRLQKSRERLLNAPLIVVPCLYLADLDDYPDLERLAAERTMAVQSLGAAIQNLLVALYSVGLDSGWMCAPLFCPDVVRDALGLSAELIPQALIPVGYVDKEPVRRSRLPLNELIIDWS